MTFQDWTLVRSSLKTLYIKKGRNPSTDSSPPRSICCLLGYVIGETVVHTPIYISLFNFVLFLDLLNRQSQQVQSFVRLRTTLNSDYDNNNKTQIITQVGDQWTGEVRVVSGTWDLSTVYYNYQFVEYEVYLLQVEVRRILKHTENS